MSEVWFRTASLCSTEFKYSTLHFSSVIVLVNPLKKKKTFLIDFVTVVIAKVSVAVYIFYITLYNYIYI